MKKETKGYILHAAFFALLMIKVFSEGFSYFCILDDYIQYGCYPKSENLLSVFFGIGTAATRPLAAFCDPLVWGAFFPRMAFPLLIISILHFLSAVLFNKCFELCDIKITPFFYAVYLLLPLGFEGTYWISASSRVVVGLFFTALCAYYLIKYIKKKSTVGLVLSVIFSIASFGFYESVTVLSGLVQGLIILLFAFKEKRYKKLWLLFVPALSGVLILLYYKLIPHICTLGSRASEFTFANMDERISEFFAQFFYIFTTGIYKTTLLGFKDGLLLLWQKGSSGIILMLLIICISAVCGIFSKKINLSAKAKVCVPVGIILTLAPLIPNVLVPDVWLTYRSMVVCLPGICILFAPLLALIFKNKTFKAFTVFAACLLFSVGCVNELHTYKAVNELDEKITGQAVDIMNNYPSVYGKDFIIVFEKEAVVPQTDFYKDHVKSVYYTDWSATGAIHAKGANIGSITPVLSLEGIDTEGKYILYVDKYFNVSEEKK